MKYVVQYTLPYEHRVMVGIEANSGDEAIAKANELFDQGEIWDDTKGVPLLYDDFEETADAGDSLVFTVESEVGGDWPEPASCVMEIRRRDAAFEVCHLLVDAYRRGEEHGGSIDWSDVDMAYQMALSAIGSATTSAHSTPGNADLNEVFQNLE